MRVYIYMCVFLHGVSSSRSSRRAQLKESGSLRQGSVSCDGGWVVEIPLVGAGIGSVGGTEVAGLI